MNNLDDWRLAGNEKAFDYFRINSYRSERYRLLYVATPKVACTSLKWWFASLEGVAQQLRDFSDSNETDPDLIIHDSFHRVAPGVALLDPGVLLKTFDAESYFRFAFVRNPYRRLFSAWQSKLLLREPLQSPPYMQCAFFQKRIDSDEDITYAFEGFLDHLGAVEAPDFRDVHWTPQATLLRPDLVNFSWLGKIEDSREFSRVLARRFGNSIPDPFAGPRTNESLIPYLPQFISKRCAELICNLYAEDFETFGYGKDPPGGEGRFGSREFEFARRAISLIRGRHKRLGQRTKQIADLKGTIAEHEEVIRGLRSPVTTREDDVVEPDWAVVECDGRNEGLRAAVTEGDSQIEALGAVVRERDGRIDALGAAVTERDGQIEALGAAVRERDGRIDALGAVVLERNVRIGALDAVIAERDMRIDTFAAAVAERDGLIAGLVTATEQYKADIDGLRRGLNEIYLSTGWRLLAPLRWYGRQRLQLRRFRPLLLNARARSGGYWPLLRRICEVQRRDGIAGVRAMLLRQAEACIPRLAPMEPPSHPAGASALSTDPEILFVSHEASRTGAPVFLIEVARLLGDRLGLSCAFLLCSGGELTEQFRAIGKTWVLGQRHELDPLTMHALKQRNIRMIYSNTITNGQVQRSLREIGCPLLCHVHELGYSIEHYFGPDNLRAVLATTDFFLAGSGAVADYLLQTAGIPAAKLAVAHPFIDVAANQRQATAGGAPLALPAGALVVGACGMIGWRKGTDLFVQVVRKVLDRVSRPVHFVWLGGPLAHGEYRNLRYDAEVLGITEHVSFVGAVDSHLAYFGRFDVFLLPSREDPFPLVVLDAASLGVPIVCFDKAGGAPELVESDAGLVVPYLDLEGMADAVTRLVENDGLRTRLGENALRKVRERHDIEVGGRRIIELVQNLLTSPVKEAS